MRHKRNGCQGKTPTSDPQSGETGGRFCGAYNPDGDKLSAETKVTTERNV